MALVVIIFTIAAVVVSGLPQNYGPEISSSSLSPEATEHLQDRSTFSKVDYKKLEEAEKRTLTAKDLNISHFLTSKDETIKPAVTEFVSENHTTLLSLEGRAIDSSHPGERLFSDQGITTQLLRPSKSYKIPRKEDNFNTEHPFDSLEVLRNVGSFAHVNGATHARGISYSMTDPEHDYESVFQIKTKKETGIRNSDLDSVTLPESREINKHRLRSGARSINFSKNLRSSNTKNKGSSNHPVYDRLRGRPHNYYVHSPEISFSTGRELPENGRKSNSNPLLHMNFDSISFEKIDSKNNFQSSKPNKRSNLNKMKSSNKDVSSEFHEQIGMNPNFKPSSPSNAFRFTNNFPQSDSSPLFSSPTFSNQRESFETDFLASTLIKSNPTPKPQLKFSFQNSQTVFEPVTPLTSIRFSSKDPLPDYFLNPQSRSRKENDNSIRPVPPRVSIRSQDNFEKPVATRSTPNVLRSSFLTDSRVPSYFNDNTQVECTEYQIRNSEGLCTTPEIMRDLFVFAEPKSKPKENKSALPLPPPKMKLNLVVIRTEDEENKDVEVVPTQREKTVVLVLKKENENKRQIIEVPSGPNEKPEVFFIDYEEGEDAALPGGITLQEVLSHSVPSSQLFGGFDFRRSQGGSSGKYRREVGQESQ